MCGQMPNGWPESELCRTPTKGIYLEAYSFLQKGARKDYLAHHFWMVKENPLGFLDSWEDCTGRRGDSAHRGYSLEQLKAIAKRAATVLKDIEHLRGTFLINTLAGFKEIETTDLLHARADPAKALAGLLRIGSHAKRFGPGKHPDREQNLWSLVLYIYECHRAFHDAKVALVLEGLGLKPSNAFALKNWRKAHGLTENEVRRNFS